jgi:hypothetical protein
MKRILGSYEQAVGNLLIGEGIAYLYCTAGVGFYQGEFFLKE